MESLGEYLKRERERRGVSLDDIARVTRVRRQHLEALEADRYGELPPPPFVRGFLAAYAREVGLGPEEVTARYERAAAAPRPVALPGEQAAVEQRARRASAPARRAAPPPGEAGSPAGREDPRAGEATGGYRGVLLLAGLVALGALAVVGSMLARPAAPSRPQPVAAASPAGSTPSRPHVAEAATDADAQALSLVEPEVGAPAGAGPLPLEVRPAAAQQEPLVSPPVARPAAVAPGGADVTPAGRVSVLTATATEDAWVQVAIDGQAPVNMLLRAGEEGSWRGGRFDVVVANAAGVSLALDGVPHPTLGAHGEVVRISLPRPASQ